MKIIGYFKTYAKVKETTKEEKQFETEFSVRKSYSLITVWITTVAFYDQESFGCSYFCKCFLSLVTVR